MRGIWKIIVLFLGVSLMTLNSIAVGFAKDIKDVLLQNGEPVVGVYYYPWFGGPPWRAVGWRPEIEYNNVDDPEQIYKLLKSITDYQINHAAYSYWDNTTYLQRLDLTMQQAEKLFQRNRNIYISPYLEPPTIDKRFDIKEGQDKNIEFVSTYLKKFGSSPCFPEVGGKKLTNIYVVYYEPSAGKAEFVEFLKAKYEDIETLNKSWKVNYRDFDEVDMGRIKPLTAAHVDLQEFRSQRLKEGWKRTREEIKKNTGFETIYTGDNSNSIVSLTDFMEALGGLTWYSFDWELNRPFARPKICSEVAKYTGSLFYYTISPGYVDRQQPSRDPGARIERDPFLYEYSWVQALSTLPEGVMILTHTEWFEGSIIDVTKEYGKKYLELTELYGTLFKQTFPSLYKEKHRKKDIAVIYNEYVTNELQSGEKDQEDVLGLIKALETLSQPFDVIPEQFVAPVELEGRKVILIPSCGLSLGKNREGKDVDEIILNWAKAEKGRTVIVTLSKKWADWLGIKYKPEIADYRSYNFQGIAFEDLSENLELTGLPPGSRVLARLETGVPKLVEVPLKSGSKVIFINGQWGKEFYLGFHKSLKEGKFDPRFSQLLEGLLKRNYRAYDKMTNSYEIKATKPLRAGETLIIYAVNTVPWSYLVQWRPVGWGAGVEHNYEDTKPWTRKLVTFKVNLPKDALVSEVLVVDSDSKSREESLRLERIKFEVSNGVLTFSYPLKFQAVFSIALCPLKLQVPDIIIHPGEKLTVPVEIENIGDKEFEGRLSLLSSPGLSATAVSFAVSKGTKTTVSFSMEAEKEYATGLRTVIFLVESEGKRYLFWRKITCQTNPALRLLTSRIVGYAGEEIEVSVALQNLGDLSAKNVTVELNGATALLEGLPRGEPKDLKLQVLMPTEPDSVKETKLKANYELFGQVVNLEFPVKLISLAKEVAGKSHYPESKHRAAIYVINQFDDLSRPSELVSLRLIRVSGVVEPNSIRLFDEKGTEMPYQLEGRDLIFVTDLNPGEVKKFYVYYDAKSGVAPEAPVYVTDLSLQNYLEQDKGFAMVKNSQAEWVFDEIKSGNPASLKPVAGNYDYAYQPGGSFVVQYDKTGKGLVSLDNVKADMRAITRGPVMAKLRNRYETEDLAVSDEWTFYSRSNFALLTREISFKKELKFRDFVALNARLSDQAFEIIWPNGVGGSHQGRKRGDLETWYIEDGYLGLTRLDGTSEDCAGIVILDKKPVSKVRYGFFEGKMEIRLRPRTDKKEFQPGENLALKLAIVAGKNLTYTYANQLRTRLLYPPLIVATTEAKPEVASVQVPAPALLAYFE